MNPRHLRFSSLRIWMLMLAVACSTSLPSCVSIVAPPAQTSHLEIAVPKSWRGLYKMDADRTLTDEGNAAVEAAIIRHYAQQGDGPRVSGVIAGGWRVEEAHKDRLVLVGYPRMVSNPHVSVQPLNIYIPGDRVKEFGEVTLTLKFE